METNTTQNNASNPTQGPQSSYGGMDQVCSGSAGMLYSLSNQLIMTYNDLQDLYGKVATAETNVQELTIKAAATAQRDAAYQQSLTIIGQAVESGIGAAITIVTTAAEKFGSGGSNEMTKQMSDLENEKAPLTKLDGMKKGVTPANRMIGDSSNSGTDVTTRMNDLKRGDYNYTGNENADTINQHAINQMSPDDFTAFKKGLKEELSTKETNINTLQSRLQSRQQTINTYGQLLTGAANGGLKGWESVTTAAAGNAQATVQVANGVQQMANSTADSSRGSIGQEYAKVSDAIAAARQGAQAYAQT